MQRVLEPYGKGIIQLGALSNATLAPESARRLPGSVLVVDGDPGTARCLAEALRQAGFPVVTAGSGERAVEIITTAHVDLMVTDLRLPDMRGDVLFFVSLNAQPHLRADTLFITNDDNEHARNLVAATGCTLLVKPFRLDEFVGAVTSLSRRRGR